VSGGGTKTASACTDIVFGALRHVQGWKKPRFLEKVFRFFL